MTGAGQAREPGSSAAVAAWALAACAFAILLAWFREADTDLWHQLAIGAHWWHTGEIEDRELFSFLPTLPRVINHEWGAGIWNYLLLRFGGRPALLLWKVAAGLGAVGAALLAARRGGASHGALLALAPVAAFCILPGFLPVVRAHVFTYLGFAILLWLVEATRRGTSWWPVPAAAALMLVWANCHGGFVAGLGLIGVYGLASLCSVAGPARFFVMGAACTAVTLVNPWGWEYWPHHLMALRHGRPFITEWKPIAFEGFTPFVGYWVMLASAAFVLGAGWKRVNDRNWAALAMFGLTLLLPFSARRHVPFCGIMGIVALAPYVDALLGNARIACADRGIPMQRLGVAACAFALVAALAFLGPGIRLNVRSPIGLFPVRECDLLERAGISGNLAVPFGWGCYAMWRLHPGIKVSIDSRYEAAYPESSFLLNDAFHAHASEDWRRLIDEHQVDFVILDLGRPGLRPEHLYAEGFRLAYIDKGTSALLVRGDRARELTERLAGVDLATMPTVEPLDPSIADRWYASGQAATPAIRTP